jgi:hypothetical protein
MKVKEQPTRLIEDPAWSSVLRPIADERLSDARLHENGARIRDRIAAMTVAAPLAGRAGAEAGGAKAATTGAKLLGLAKITVPIVAMVALAVPVAQRVLRSQGGAEKTNDVQMSAPAVDGDDDRNDEAVEELGVHGDRKSPKHERRHKRNQVSSRSQRPTQDARESDGARSGEAPAVVERAEPAPLESRRIEAKTPAKGGAPAQRAPGVADSNDATGAEHGEGTAGEDASRRSHDGAPLWPAPPSHKANANTLAEQLELYSQAKEAAGRGKYERALLRLDELEHRFPDTALAPEIVLSRADYLARAGRRDEAIAFIDRALSENRVMAKKAEVLRLLGDLWLDRGDCGKATDAFRRALAYGLSREEAEHARKGIEGCTVPR